MDNIANNGEILTIVGTKEEIEQIKKMQGKEILELLLKHDANPDTPNKKGATPLIDAINNQKQNTVTVIELLRGGTDANEKDNVGKTVLMYAVQRGHLEIVKLLIGNGADVNFKNEIPKKGFSAMTALPLVAFSHNKTSVPQIVSTLTNIGADVDVFFKNFCQDNENKDVVIEGYTTLMVEMEKDKPDVEVVKALLDAGAKMDLKYTTGKHQGKTIFEVAMEKGDDIANLFKNATEKRAKITSPYGFWGTLNDFIAKVNEAPKTFGSILSSNRQKMGGARLGAAEPIWGEHPNGSNMIDGDGKKLAEFFSELPEDLRSNVYIACEYDIPGHLGQCDVVLVRKNDEISEMRVLVVEMKSWVRGASFIVSNDTTKNCNFYNEVSGEYDIPCPIDSICQMKQQHLSPTGYICHPTKITEQHPEQHPVHQAEKYRNLLERFHAFSDEYGCAKFSSMLLMTGEDIKRGDRENRLKHDVDKKIIPTPNVFSIFAQREELRDFLMEYFSSKIFGFVKGKLREKPDSVFKTLLSINEKEIVGNIITEAQKEILDKIEDKTADKSKKYLVLLRGPKSSGKTTLGKQALMNRLAKDFGKDGSGKRSVIAFNDKATIDKLRGKFNEVELGVERAFVKYIDYKPEDCLRREVEKHLRACNIAPLYELVVAHNVPKEDDTNKDKLKAVLQSGQTVILIVDNDGNGDAAGRYGAKDIEETWVSLFGPTNIIKCEPLPPRSYKATYCRKCGKYRVKTYHHNLVQTTPVQTAVTPSQPPAWDVFDKLGYKCS